MSIEYCEECHRSFDTDYNSCLHLASEDNIADYLRGENFRVITNPKTVFIPFDLEPTFLMKRLRDEFGYMIQTEIT